MDKSQHSNSEKLILRIGFAVLLLLFFMRAANAQVSHCEQEKNVIRRDQCYLDNARSVTDCEPIYSNLTKGECIEKNAQSIEDCLKIEKATVSKRRCIERFLTSFNEPSQCDVIPEEYQAECYANVTYNNYPEEISKCYDLTPAYQDECIAIYIKRKEIADLNYCSEIKTDLQKECAYWASLNKYFDVSANKLKQGVTKEECDQYQGEIKAGCVKFFNSAKTTGVVGLFGFGLIGSTILILFLPALIVGAVITVIVIIVRRKRRMNGNTIPYSISQKPILKIALAVLALVLITSTVYAGWKIWKDIPEPQDYGFYQSFIEHRKLAELQEDISSWRTYQNEEYGYEVKYPEDWYLYDANLADVRMQPYRDEPGSIPGPEAKAVEIIVSKDFSGNLDEYIRKRYAGAAYSETRVYIDDVEGVKTVQTEEAVGQGKPIIFLPKGEMIYELNPNLGDTRLFEQIVSTFRFIE